MKKIIVIATLALLAGCTSADKSTRVLQESGYTDIHITGYNFFGCGNDDSFHTGFTAKGPTGQSVEGTVCSGFLKSSTIRLK